ncbi:MAG: metal-dependent transcriptional regulator [Desulfurococcales archaeon]|nr:metal-dependent transcriptional regulator [Desulfurococcales archaeon]
MVNSLSTRDIDYLITIYEFSASRGAARVIDVAKVLGVSKSTASLMIKKLEKQGLITKVSRGVKLTSEGVKTCLEVIWRHGVIEVALTRLGLNPEEACAVARDIELSIPRRIIEKLWHLLGRPAFCPHGGVIITEGNGAKPVCTCRFSVICRHNCVLKKL